jgi:hypothetical protein
MWAVWVVCRLIAQYQMAEKIGAATQSADWYDSLSRRREIIRLKHVVTQSPINLYANFAAAQQWSRICTLAKSA